MNYVNWSVINLCYYGLTMNSVNLNGDLFINTILGVLIEAPGYLLAMLTMDRFGRKPILVICQLGKVSKNKKNSKIHQTYQKSFQNVFLRET